MSFAFGLCRPVISIDLPKKINNIDFEKHNLESFETEIRSEIGTILNPKELSKIKNVIDNLIKEITKENNITTVINSHDMNSVMEIGDSILFLKDGKKAWEGSKELIFKTDNEAVNDFVYSSNLMKKIKQVHT